MSSGIEKSGASANGDGGEGLKAVFLMPSFELVRLFEGFLRAMLGRGHQVMLALEDRADGAEPPFLDELRDRHPGFDYRRLPPRRGPWLIPATAIRRRLDYLRYLEPEYADAEVPHDSDRPKLRSILLLPPFRWSPIRRVIGWLLAGLERGMPVPRDVKDVIAEYGPDVVLVSPLVELGSGQGDYLRAAHDAKIPSAFLVAGGDDLARKGGIRDVPTLTVAWSEAQADEAVNLHRLPREQIVAVGSESSDGDLAPAPAGAAEAIERTAATEVTTSRSGRRLTPLIWLLTPLMLILLPLLRPRATGRAVIKFLRAIGRVPGRIRKQWKARKKARARAQKVEQVELRRERKLARAEAKQRVKGQAEAPREPQETPVVPAGKSEQAPPAPGSQTEKTHAT